MQSIKAGRPRGTDAGSRQWLARLVGVTPPSISNLLNPQGPKQSRLVDPVSEILGIALPQYEDATEEQQIALLRRLRRQNPQRWREVLEIIREAAAVSDGSDNS